jgi:F0F1-type ATP synthase epsilon subunit
MRERPERPELPEGPERPVPSEQSDRLQRPDRSGTTALRVQLPDRRLDYPAIAALRLRLEDGWAGFLPGHAPFLGLFPPGVVGLDGPAGPQALAVAGGWLWVRRGGFALYTAAAAPLAPGEDFAAALAREHALAEAVEARRAGQEARLERALEGWPRAAGRGPR